MAFGYKILKKHIQSGESVCGLKGKGRTGETPLKLGVRRVAIRSEIWATIFVLLYPPYKRVEPGTSRK